LPEVVVKRLVVLLGIAVLVAALGWALDSAAVPLPRQLASPERGPEPGMMALGALGLLAIGAALRRRS
jgi:MYXO-CTERM domain-containing protein